MVVDDGTYFTTSIVHGGNNEYFSGQFGIGLRRASLWVLVVLSCPNQTCPNQTCLSCVLSLCDVSCPNVMCLVRIYKCMNVCLCVRIQWVPISYPRGSQLYTPLRSQEEKRMNTHNKNKIKPK